MLLRCRLCTPVFGGGVEPMKFDELTPIRVSELRGQLRFWWRATSALRDVDALREAESAIFGGVHGKAPRASQVSFAVTRQPGRPLERPVFKNEKKIIREQGVGPGLAYGAFGLRETSNQHAVLYKYERDFEIEVRCPEAVRTDVERALWALFHFGGLGGRTRRGFGALDLLASPGFTLAGIEEGWPRDLASAPRWPTLAARPTSSKPFSTALDALEAGLRLLFEMRQGTQDGRAAGHPTPGRSYWPEPDALRHLNGGRAAPGHGTPITSVKKFPRAAFGAPIIFQFKDEKRGDPPVAELVPMRGGELLTRMASPLIIRPHRDPDGRYRVLALKLAVPPAQWAIRHYGARPVPTELMPSEAAEVRPLRGIADPIDAYLDRLAKL
jgi:CRISPR-associated protein Cmr1